MRLVLFDIDGTLILTNGAGMRAFYRAFESVFDLPVRSEVIRPDGKTDPLIAKELLAYFGQKQRWNDHSRASLFEAYLGFLTEEMDLARRKGAIRVLPGVRELLNRLMAQPDFAVGLVTGNLEGGALIKLQKAGLEHFFRFGGYGSDSEDRTALIRVGIQRGRVLVAPAPVEAAFVIGDTPLDILHGRAAGASVIAVASSRYSVGDLQSHHPDLLVPSLEPIEPVLSFMES
jgi:phosphoglycolate phosphatase